MSANADFAGKPAITRRLHFSHKKAPGISRSFTTKMHWRHCQTLYANPSVRNLSAPNAMPVASHFIRFSRIASPFSSGRTQRTRAWRMVYAAFALSCSARLLFAQNTLSFPKHPAIFQFSLNRNFNIPFICINNIRYLEYPQCISRSAFQGCSYRSWGPIQ